MTDERRSMQETGELEFDDEAVSAEAEGRVKFTVPEGMRKTRLDAFLSSVADLSRSRLKRLVEQGGCTVDGLPCTDADFKVRSGQEVELCMPGASDVLVPEEGPLDVVYSDADIAVVNKPAGLTVHPCPSCPQGRWFIGCFPGFRSWRFRKARDRVSFTGWTRIRPDLSSSPFRSVQGFVSSRLLPHGACIRPIWR